MKSYLVTWKINLTAESPEEAAREALTIQRDANSLALCFTVQDEDTKEETEIDLEEI